MNKQIFLILLFFNMNLFNEKLIIKLDPKINRRALIELMDKDGVIQADGIYQQITHFHPFQIEVPKSNEYYITSVQFQHERKANIVKNPTDGLGPLTSGTYVLCESKPEKKLNCPTKPSTLKSKLWPNISITKIK
jgi:hypothetical protein